MGRFGSLEPRFDYRYKSKVYYTPRNYDWAGDDSRWVFDVRVDYRELSGRFQVGVWMRNILNEAYRTTIVYEANAAMSDPRTYGITMVLEF